MLYHKTTNRSDELFDNLQDVKIEIDKIFRNYLNVNFFLYTINIDRS